MAGPCEPYNLTRFSEASATQGFSFALSHKVAALKTHRNTGIFKAQKSWVMAKAIAYSMIALQCNQFICIVMIALNSKFFSQDGPCVLRDLTGLMLEPRGFVSAVACGMHFGKL